MTTINPTISVRDFLDPDGISLVYEFRASTEHYFHFSGCKINLHPASDKLLISVINGSLDSNKDRVIYEIDCKTQKLSRFGCIQTSSPEQSIQNITRWRWPFNRYTSLTGDKETFAVKTSLVSSILGINVLQEPPETDWLQKIYDKAWESDLEKLKRDLENRTLLELAESIRNGITGKIPFSVVLKIQAITRVFNACKTLIILNDTKKPEFLIKRRNKKTVTLGRVTRVLGSGTYGTVYEVLILKTQKLFAMKVNLNKESDLTEEYDTLKEIHRLGRIQHLQAPPEELLYNLKYSGMEDPITFPEHSRGFGKNAKLVEVGYLGTLYKKESLAYKLNELNYSVAKGSLTANDVLLKLITLSKTLEEMNERGFIHTDFHEGNILYEDTPSGEEEVISDLDGLLYFSKDCQTCKGSTLVFNRRISKEEKKICYDLKNQILKPSNSYRLPSDSMSIKIQALHDRLLHIQWFEFAHVAFRLLYNDEYDPEEPVPPHEKIPDTLKDFILNMLNPDLSVCRQHVSSTLEKLYQTIFLSSCADSKYNSGKREIESIEMESF